MAVNTNGLTTVARVKSFLGISVADHDAVLEMLVNVVSDFVELYCDRVIRKTAYTNEVYDGTGSNKMLLKNFPVISTETFTFGQRDTDLNDNSWTNRDSEEYHVDWDTGIVDWLTNMFRDIPRHYRFTYTAGYDIDNSTPTATKTLELKGLADLEWAVWEMIKEAFRQRKQAGDINSESIGDYSVTYNTESPVMRKIAMADPNILSVLDAYKRPHKN